MEYRTLFLFLRYVTTEAVYTVLNPIYDLWLTLLGSSSVACFDLASLCVKAADLQHCIGRSQYMYDA